MLTTTRDVPGFRGLQRRLLVTLKRAQPLTVKELAAEFKITPNALRRHLKSLEESGTVEYRRVIRGVGGPTFAYSLTEAGESLFPRAYAGPLAEALEVVRRAQGTEGVVNVFRQQWATLADAARERMSGLPLPERAVVLAELRTEQGYMADAEAIGQGEALIREHNCAIRDIAGRFPEVCAAEAQFFAELLGADVVRQSHMLEGCNACTYRVRAPIPPSVGRWTSPGVEDQA